MIENIPTLNPDSFKKLLMANVNHSQLADVNFNEFYIHNLANQSYNLKLPLPPHRKTVNDFILITSGSMIKTAGLDRYKVQENTLFLVPAGQITTTIEVSPAVTGYYCHFSTRFLAKELAQIDVLNHFPFLVWLNNPVVQLSPYHTDVLVKLLERIDILYRQQSNNELIRSYIFTFLSELKILFHANAKLKIAASQRVAFEFKQCLTKHINARHDVQFYAKELNVSTNHLNKCVKQVFRKPTSKIIGEFLILEAEVLLHQRSIPISQISSSLGFDDPSYFGRFFKKQTGLTPSEFRNLIVLSD